LQCYLWEAPAVCTNRNYGNVNMNSPQMNHARIPKAKGSSGFENLAHPSPFSDYQSAILTLLTGANGQEHFEHIDIGGQDIRVVDAQWRSTEVVTWVVIGDLFAAGRNAHNR
jgi:hypothetical protein